MDKKISHKDKATKKKSSSVKTDTSDLPPHMILGMPALSPTMVWKIPSFLYAGPYFSTVSIFDL